MRHQVGGVLSIGVKSRRSQKCAVPYPIVSPEPLLSWRFLNHHFQPFTDHFLLSSHSHQLPDWTSSWSYNIHTLNAVHFLFYFYRLRRNLRTFCERVELWPLTWKRFLPTYSIYTMCPVTDVLSWLLMGWSLRCLHKSSLMLQWAACFWRKGMILRKVDQIWLLKQHLS